MIYRDFDTDLKTGERAEELVLSKFKTIIQPVVMRIAYKDGLIAKELQRKGIDVYVQQKETGFDIKVRDFKYYRFKDILLETKSVREKDIPGWLYKATVVVYLWWNPLRTKFVDGYVLFLQNIRDWMTVTQFDYKKKIAFSNRNGQSWSTENIIVPISDFPIGCAIRLSKKEFLDQTQIKLGEYFDDKGFVPSACPKSPTPHSVRSLEISYFYLDNHVTIAANHIVLSTPIIPPNSLPEIRSKRVKLSGFFADTRLLHTTFFLVNHKIVMHRQTKN